MKSKLAHLQMLQTVVTRMSTNSFFLKGWTVTLVAALFALASVKASPYFIFLAYFPAVVFWFLDGYFLWQERLFRGLYDKVRLIPEERIDFSMDTSLVAAECSSWRDACFSKTLLLFYGVLFASILAVWLILVGRA